MPYLKTERNTFLQMNIFQDLTKVKAVHMSRQSVMKAYFTIDYFNQLAAYAVSGTSKNYAYVVNCYYEPGPATGEIRLFTKDGTFETYTLDKKITFNDKRVDKADVPEMLKTTSPDGSVNQLIICKPDNNGYIKNIKTAVNKTSETYYVAK